MRCIFDGTKNIPHPEPPLLGGESKDAVSPSSDDAL
jgi:hypothetical protein